MKKIFIILILIISLTSCFNDKKIDKELEVKESNMLLENINNKIIENINEEWTGVLDKWEYNTEIQGLINNQMENWPYGILKLECNKEYTDQETINYCLEQQAKVKKIFKIEE